MADNVHESREYLPQGGELVFPAQLVEIDELTGGVEDANPELAELVARIAVGESLDEIDFGPLVEAIPDNCITPFTDEDSEIHLVDEIVELD